MPTLINPIASTKQQPSQDLGATTTPKLPGSLAAIQTACELSGIHTAEEAAILLRQSNVTREDLLAWADFDHPVTDGYGRRAVALGSNYELMIMSWNHGDFSAIHDHGNTQWGAVQYFGVAEHATYRLEGSLLKTNERVLTQDGQINLVDQDLIHQMGNPTDQPLLSLHLYGCATPVDGITGDARVFDLLNGEIQTTDGGVFYCLPDDKINTRSKGMLGDRETTLEHHHQMLDRVRKIRDDAALNDRAHWTNMAHRLAEEILRQQSPYELAA